MENAERVEALIRQLDSQREAYQETLTNVHELLAQNLAATVRSNNLPTSSSPPEAQSQRSNRKSDSYVASEREKANRKASELASFQTSSLSKTTGEDSDSDDGADEALYVQTPLEPQTYDMETLRSHLRSYAWDKHCRMILEGVVGNPSRLAETPLVPNRKGKLEDRSDVTHYQVFDVGPDGSPLAVDFSHIEKDFGRAMALWHAVKEVNPVTKQRYAVGRITIVREPSPILFGVIHYTMNKMFDVDELFRHLYLTDVTSASLDRAFETDVRRQRSFVFNFEYFTLIGKDCEPMKWQLAAGQEDRKPNHISITRCSSVIALVLHGPKIKDVKNPFRRKARGRGPVRMLSAQSFRQGHEHSSRRPL